MDTVIGWIALPLGYVMKWCYDIFSNYGIAIIFFTLLTKVILFPLNIVLQKNSIKMLKMQPEINRIKAKFFGDKDTIADKQSELYKREHYHPLLSLIPLAAQIILLMGVVGVIYGPFNYLLHLDQGLIDQINNITVGLNIGSKAGDNSLQLAAIKAIQNGYASSYAAVVPSDILNQIQNLNFDFLTINMGWNPSVIIHEAMPMPIYAICMPLCAGFSAWFMCFMQNKSQVLQSEQGALSKYGLMIFSVALSLYLGFFVPAGIALYWVFSNLFAVLVMYVLNATIRPKKYVDYEALHASQEELKALENVNGDEKQSSEIKKRERADYKRFFSIANKHVVFYSEKSGFYKYFEDIIGLILKYTNLSVHYITNDPNDIIFEKAKENDRIKPYYISVKRMITLFMKMDADMVLMTTPDLDNYYIKRSMYKKDVEYIYMMHSGTSMHMQLKEHALDNFDTVLCSGPHLMKEIRAMEKLNGSREKTLVEYGHPLIEKLCKANESLVDIHNEKKQILIGPSWQEDNLLDSCIDTLIDSLWCDDYHIIVRPHPEYMKRYKPKMDAIIERHKDQIGDNLTFETDFSSNVSTYASDLLITDWSGLMFDFVFSTLRPVLTVNTKMKVENENYEKTGIVPQEVALRNEVGISLNKDELGNVKEVVANLLEDNSYKEKIKNIRENYFFNFGSGGTGAVKYIIKRLQEIEAKNKK